MKRDDYLKHLDRAFTQAPPELTASVEEAFRRGEEAMKQRHKSMTALSVAAAVAVLCAALALAAGTMMKPRRDDVVAARGKGDTGMPAPIPGTAPEKALYFATTAGVYYHIDAHCGGMMNATPVAEADALADGKQPCPICVTGKVKTGKAAPTDAPRSLNAEIAVEWLRKLDERSANAEEIWFFPSSEAEGAWVFYATGYNADAALYEGGAWYLGENSVCLGYSRAVSAWMFCTPGEPKGTEFLEITGEYYDIGGEHIGYGPELFTSVIRTDDGNRVHAWKVDEGGRVIEVDAGEKLRSIGVSGGLLYGLTEEDSGDLCFLRERDGQLYQVCGQPVEVSAVEKLPGGKALLDELRRDFGYTVTGCQYRSMGEDIEAEVVTVNLEWEGMCDHAYLFREKASDELDCEHDWEGDIAIFDDTGSAVVDAGLPTVTSGGIEATQKGRAWDARMGLASKPTPGPQSEAWEAAASRNTPVQEAFPVYYTLKGNYYHGYALCSGMRNAEAHTLAEAVDDGKARCPACQPGEPEGIHMFRKVFGCGLEELYHDARYAYTLRDAQTGVCEWTLCYPGDSSATYGNPVVMEDYTIREGSSIPGHVGQTVPRMSVWTNADNALTVWRCAPEPLHGMLEEAEAALRDRPEMLAGIKSTPLEWLTRTFVTFDGAGEDLLAVTLWFEGQAATTTFRWVRDEDGAYRMSLTEAGEG